MQLARHFQKNLPGWYTWGVLLRSPLPRPFQHVDEHGTRMRCFDPPRRAAKGNSRTVTTMSLPAYSLTFFFQQHLGLKHFLRGLPDPKAIQADRQNEHTEDRRICLASSPSPHHEGKAITASPCLVPSFGRVPRPRLRRTACL